MSEETNFNFFKHHNEIIRKTVDYLQKLAIKCEIRDDYDLSYFNVGRPETYISVLYLNDIYKIFPLYGEFTDDGIVNGPLDSDYHEVVTDRFYNDPNVDDNGYIRVGTMEELGKILLSLLDRSI